MHGAFPKGEIRNFFSDSILEAQAIENRPKPTIPKYADETSFDWNNRYMAAEIAHMQETLRARQHRNAVYDLMVILGWQEWDCSDTVERDEENWRCFIGTKDEKLKLMEMAGVPVSERE